MGECSRCHVDYYHNPEVRVFFSAVCDHRVCERCISRLFRDKTCPGCGKTVRAEDFSEHPRESREVESEVKVRRQVCDIYCKSEQDFVSAEEWDEYLVMREDIIYVLATPSSQDEVQETWRRIDQYREQNAEQILRAQHLRPRKKLQKLASIMKQEGTFASLVNADWNDRSNLESPVHPFQGQYRRLEEDLPASPQAGGLRSTEAAVNVSPLYAPQALLGGHGPSGKARQMSGGGQPPDTCLKKARHFFLLDLASVPRPVPSA
ncbi:unnamed protein product [Polarella glacialis]|uniref:RING-type domain-containing protein n=1 Tax=Polarella glacialis TaxID=89957 RepID=A0A813KYZ0_POLGL|nr:unnamed protein product [Polarella glacialis]|mmetsp:Transcript_40388/g.73171  ORF Transcript_40388/g.73171 Transcript_40388/m.73171 type:complete len:263 (-) Transcript_40388:92-880(-)